MSEPVYPLSVLSDFSRESYAKGYAAGVQAARDAVAAFPGRAIMDDASYIHRADAIAAIDALRGEHDSL